MSFNKNSKNDNIALLAQALESSEGRVALAQAI